MNDLFHKNLLIGALVSLTLAACSPEAKHDAARDHDGHDNEVHGENGVSDLDRPVAELFAASCEHNIRTHECSECRYEVGVVKACADLFDGGLLKTVKPKKRAVTVPLTLTGEVQFDERRVTHVTTQTEGIIRKVHVMLGDTVEPGQPLIELESVAVGDAEATYLEARGILKLARRNHDRVDALRKEAISSEKELLLARQKLDAAQSRTNGAFGKLVRLGMTPSSARALTRAKSRGRLVLRAPAAGTVLEMHAVAGEIARPETSIATIGENSSLWVWADLYEQDVARVTRGQAQQSLAAQVDVKAFPGEHFPGTVDFVSPAMSESSRTVKLRIAVPNSEGRLLAGMFAGVKIFLPGDESALTVPKGATLEDERRTFVFVHHEGEYYVRRPVVTGRTFDGLVEVTNGLDGSEVVVADGAFLMKSDVLRSKMGAGCAH